MSEQTLDTAQAEAFAARMLTTLNDAFLAMLISVGDQTQLFDTLAKHSPVTCEELARAAGLKERYVREWLGGMLVGRVVTYDVASKTYTLPPEHAASLTHAAGPNNIATSMRFVSCLGEVEPKVVDCFRCGGGVPYSAYPRFHEIMRSWSAQILDANLLDRTLPLVPGMTDRLKQGAQVLDVGCGAGHAVNLMARAFPSSRFVGYDFSDEALGTARAEATAWGLENAHFAAQDVAAIPDRQRFDLITAIDAIHDQAQPRRVLAGIAAALRPGGVFLMVDDRASSHPHENVDHPTGPFLYGCSMLHCMTVSLALDGEGLGAAWGEQKACELLAEAGFANVTIQTLPGDVFNNYYVARLA